MRFWLSNGAKARKQPEPVCTQYEEEEEEVEEAPDLEAIPMQITGKIAPLAIALGFKLRDREGVPTVIWSNRAERPATETEVAMHERILVLENELVAMHKFLTEAAGSLTKRITAVDALRSTPAAAPTPPPQNVAAATPPPVATPAPTVAAASMSSTVAASAAPKPMSEERRRELREKFRNRTPSVSPAARPKLPG